MEGFTESEGSEGTKGSAEAEGSGGPEGSRGLRGCGPGDPEMSEGPTVCVGL